jgi:hypothetical protein
VSNDCTAPDVGIAPLITDVSILDVVGTTDGSPDTSRIFEVRITGDQLCEATVEGAGLGNPLDLELNTSGTSLGNNVFYSTEDSDRFSSATYHFDINRGAVAGTLPFIAIDPDGPLEILSPAFGATVSADPTFTLSKQCTNCGINTIEIIENVNHETIDFFTLAFGGLQTDLQLSRELVPLPDGPYLFEATAITGVVHVDETFIGDPNQVEFNYLSGKSIRNRLHFNVPEPGPVGAGTAAVIALLGIGRPRGSRAGSRGARRSRRRERSTRFNPIGAS